MRNTMTKIDVNVRGPPGLLPVWNRLVPSTVTMDEERKIQGNAAEFSQLRW